MAVCAAVSANAQDVIVMRNADEIKAKITAVTPNEVTYIKWDNPNGPTYTIYKDEVFYVRYENGTKDVFSDVNQPQNGYRFYKGVYNPAKSNSGGKYHFDSVKFQSYVYAGTIFQAGIGGPSVDLSFGARLFDYAYVGIETGFHMPITDAIYYYEDTYLFGYIPIGLNIKGYIPTGKKIFPYINCTLGGFVGVIDFGGHNGFYCQVGAGIDIKRFSFGIGYSGLVQTGAINCGYVKLGVRIGKW